MRPWKQNRKDLMMTAMNEEAMWQAENDARTLANAEAIKADKGRLERARAAAKRMAQQEREQANAMNKVAGGKALKEDREETTPKKQAKKPHVERSSDGGHKVTLPPTYRRRNR